MPSVFVHVDCYFGSYFAHLENVRCGLRIRGQRRVLYVENIVSVYFLGVQFKFLQRIYAMSKGTIAFDFLASNRWYLPCVNHRASSFFYFCDVLSSVQLTEKSFSLKFLGRQIRPNFDVFLYFLFAFSPKRCARTCVLAGVLYNDVMLVKFPDFYGWTIQKTCWWLAYTADHAIGRNDIEIGPVVFTVLC